MKIIDKTPLQDDKGEISFFNRIQGTLKYGMNWYNDLEAQKTVIDQMNQMIEKGYVLIRNFTLPNSEIVIPVILIGVSGVYVISITSVKGYFEARGDQWNTVSNGKASPAPVNLISRTVQMAKAFQKYLELNKISIPVTVEAVLIVADPGAHIDSVRPAARVVMSDAIRQFVTNLLQGRPVLSPDKVYSLADRVLDPRSNQPAPAAPAAAPSAFNPVSTDDEVSADDLGFAFQDEADDLRPSIMQSVGGTPPARNPRRAAPKKARVMGMSMPQFLLLAGMLLVEICVLAGFAYIILTSS